jgi:tetratricopeptide (TPR) repeat protein
MRRFDLKTMTQGTENIEKFNTLRNKFFMDYVPFLKAQVVMPFTHPKYHEILQCVTDLLQVSFQLEISGLFFEPTSTSLDKPPFRCHLAQEIFKHMELTPEKRSELILIIGEFKGYSAFTTRQLNYCYSQNPNSPQVMLNMAHWLNENGKFNELLFICDRALSIQPPEFEVPEIPFSPCEEESYSQNFDFFFECQSSGGKEEKLSDINASFYKYKAIALSMLGKHHEALETILMVKKIQPRGPDAQVFKMEMDCRSWIELMSR